MKKGKLRGTKHLNIAIDEALGKALEASAAANERKASEEARFAIRKHLGIFPAPAEDTAGVSA